MKENIYTRMSQEGYGFVTSVATLQQPKLANLFNNLYIQVGVKRTVRPNKKNVKIQKNKKNVAQ